MTDTGSKESCDVRLYLRGHKTLSKLKQFRQLQAVENVTKEMELDDTKIWYRDNKSDEAYLNCQKTNFTKDENENS